MEWIVIGSILIMTALSLFRVNVIIAIIIAALSAGLMAGLSVEAAIGTFITEISSGTIQTAFSYILLGAFAIGVNQTGITKLLVNFLIRVLTGKRTMLLLVIAGVASLSQNLIPVHIAFIPILIPPLLKLFDQMRLDRRAVALALTFGLKTPYIVIPFGFGLVFQKIVLDGLIQNGIPDFTLGKVTLAMIVPALGMVVGLLFGIFITYRKERSVISDEVPSLEEEVESVRFQQKHIYTIVAIIGTLGTQIVLENLIAGALVGLIILFITGAVPFKLNNKVMTDGISLMGTIAFVMLAASGFAGILKETGAVQALVDAAIDLPGMSSKPLVAFSLLVVGLVITIGIGTSFGTVPILAALYVPICLALGFSPIAIAVLIGTAAALGDAGSPASDSTLGPTAGLNADGHHDHIWDTCVPTFLHYNTALFILGWTGAVFL